MSWDIKYRLCNVLSSFDIRVYLGLPCLSDCDLIARFSNPLPIYYPFKTISLPLQNLSITPSKPIYYPFKILPSRLCPRFVGRSGPSITMTKNFPFLGC